jgi:hypothetical protein
MTKRNTATHTPGSLPFYFLLGEKIDKLMIVLYAVNDWSIRRINSRVFKESACLTHMCAPSEMDVKFNSISSIPLCWPYADHCFKITKSRGNINNLFVSFMIWLGRSSLRSNTSFNGDGGKSNSPPWLGAVKVGWYSIA